MNSYPQCPNCGGFKTFSLYDQWKENNQPISAGGYLVIMIILLVFPIGTIIGLYMLFNQQPKQPAPSPNLYKCQLCAYEWVQKSGQVLPVNVRPDLIQQGEQQLREEAEERQRQAQAQRDAEGAFWLNQQQKK